MKKLMRMTSTTCRNCEGVLCENEEIERLDSSNMPSWLQYDGTKYFIRCPQCSAKNIVIRSTDPTGMIVLTITRVVMEDDL